MLEVKLIRVSKMDPMHQCVLKPHLLFELGWSYSIKVKWRINVSLNQVINPGSDNGLSPARRQAIVLIYCIWLDTWGQI